MTFIGKLQMRTLIIGLALVPLTALSIYFIYGSYSFSNWPWFNFSALMAILTCLWVFAFEFIGLVQGEKGAGSSFFFALVVIPFDVLLAYPGLKALGIDSDPDMLTLLIVLGIIHGFGFYFIQREARKYQQDSAKL